MKILLSVFACDPSQGSEAGIGYSWAYHLALLGYDVTCVTSIKGRAAIESEKNRPSKLRFVYVELPTWADKLYNRSTLGMYCHYLFWQWRAYKHVKKNLRENQFDVVHHISWASLQLGSFMYKLKIPFIFGPVGGGQRAPLAFAAYFGKHWRTEKKREMISKLLVHFNPGCYIAARKAKAVIVVNKETYQLAEKLGARRIERSLDAILPESFAPQERRSRINGDGLKLLWVGRMMPRKGVFLVLDVMERLDPRRRICLTIVGDGQQKMELDERIRDKGLENVVKTIGAVPYSEVKKYYLEHDAFLFTSLRDSGPSQLVEAMAFGLPVITLDMHGQGIIVDTDRGIKVPAETPEKSIVGLAQALTRLSADRQWLEQMSINAFEFARNEIAINKVARIARQVYY